MSGNQKQAPSGAPQQQRYAQGPYSPRAPTSQRADGYHVTTPPTGYVPQQASNQQANQGQNIRGMAPTGPPNQSSTPPQNDLKQMQQQSGQLPMFVQQQVRAGQPSGGFFRTPTPNQGGPRISNHHRQTMASNAAAATPIYSQHMQIYPTPMAQPMTSYPMTMQYNAPRPPGNYYGQPFPVMHGQFLHGTFPTQQAQAQQFYYPNATALTMANRQGPPPPVAAAPPQGTAQATQQPMQMQPAMTQPTKRKNRSNAIPIINPLSGKEIFDEEESQPPSGESSARETPQPPSTTAMQQLISADFAARVAIVASEDKVQAVEPEPPVPVTVTYGAPITMQPPPVPQPHNAVHMVAVCPPKENDVHKVIESSVVQNSKLQASVKEFIPEVTKHVPKESTTPVVSANTEGVEVTLPNKQSRDRESPSKIRRNQPHQHQPHHLHQQPHHQQPHHQQPHQQQPHPQQPHQQQPHQQQAHQQQAHQQQPHQQQPHQQQAHQQQVHQQQAHQQQPHQQQAHQQQAHQQQAHHQQPHQQLQQAHQQHQPEQVPQQHREPPKEIIVPAGPPSVIAKEVPRAQVSVSPVNQVAAHEPELKDLKPVVVNAKVKSMPPSEFTKGPPPVPVDHRPTPPQQPHTNSVAAVVDDTIVNAKSKGGAQKAKESLTSVAVQPPAPKAAMPVPGSQPAKPSSKANKLRELNMKGANKEGTDMDAFNSSIAAAATTPPIENCNSEPAPPVVVAPKEELIEPEPEQIPTPTPPPPQQQQPVPPIQAPVQPAAQVMAPPPQKAEVKPATLPKQKIDITSIVKEIPRPLKPQPAPATQEQMQSQQSTTDSNDETDRAACEKLVQVKNETNNIKTNSSEISDTQVIDKTVIRYKKDQWSPMNTDGKKSYDRDFLMNLQMNPKCKKKPDNLPDLEIILKDSNRARADPRSFSSNRQSELLMPAFHKSLSQRGPLPKRNSQQGNKAGNKGGSKPNTIHVTLSLREDVKLRETENAWRPARQNASDSTTKDEMKTADLYKKVRGVLNKLTPEKFEKLLNQVRSLSIDNEERLQGVIDLVFEKAVDEPNFSVAYANMCKELATMQVPANSKNKDDPEFVNFRKLLITRCQLEFEKNTQLENERILKQKEVEACTDPEKIKELQMQLEDDERRMRVKSVGNIRFIGELFKQNMLTVRIMLRCMNILLENKDEDSLECLCKLLTTIGKDLESKNQNLQNYFTQMQDFVDKKRGRISSRVRFMLQDVIDLRNSKWVPRRQDLNPKTMDQIQKEADTEQLNIQVMNLNPMTPRKDDRLGGQGSSSTNSDHKRRSNQTDDSGWTIPTSRNRTPYTVESSKLMNKPPPMEEMTLGSKNLFGQWGRGSNIKTQTHAPITNTANMYAALENINADAEKSRPSYGKHARMNKDPYVSKGHSMDRSGYKQTYEDGRGSRSGSQHRNQPHQHQQPQPQKAPVVAPPPVPVVSAAPQPNPEQLRLRMKNILDEYLNDCTSLTECEQDIRASIDPSKLSQFIEVGCNGMLERSQSKRHKTGKLYSHLIKCDLLSIDDMCASLTDVLSQADDLIIDVPMLWNYLSEMILPLVTDDVITLDILCKCSEVLVTQGYAHKLFAQLLKQLVADKGPNYVADIWKVSGIRCADFMPAEDVDAYINNNKFDFLIGGAGTPVVIPSSFSWEQVHIKLLQLFKSNTHSDTVFDWINANVGERVKENQFVRKLVTAVVEVSVTSVNESRRLRYETLKTYYYALQRYIDNQEILELQCILAVQALVQKWDHPPGLLLSIFLKLWEDGILSNDCFLAWEKNNDPMEQEGKGVALKSLQSLFTALKENDYETMSSTSDDA